MPSCTVVHPSAAYRHGVRSVLDSSGYDVVEPAALAGRPDVVLLFLDEDDHWQQLAEAVRHDAVIVALMPNLALGGYRRALALGADGVCDANLPPEMIARVVDAAMAGEVTIPAEMARRLVAGLGEAERAVALTSEEQDLLQRHAEGEAIPDLAKELFLGERTVRRRLQNICVKLGVRNRAEAIKKATQLGIIA